MTSVERETIASRLFVEFELALLPFLLPIGYLLWQLIGLDDAPTTQVAWTGAAAIAAGCIAGPWQIARTRLAAATRDQADATSRLAGLLQLPRRTELDFDMSVFLGLLAFSAGWMWRLGRPLWLLVVVALFSSSMLMIVGLRYALRAERILRPVAIAVFQSSPDSRPTGPTMLWPRMGWYLGFTFNSMLLASLTAVAALVVGKGLRFLAAVQHELVVHLSPDQAAAVTTRLESLSLELVVALLLLAVFMLVFAHLSARQLGQRYEEASTELRSAVTDVAKGTPRLPAWVSTDEFGDLSFGLAEVFSRLKAVSDSLKRSASQLADGARTLQETSGTQNETIARQSAALQETEVTAQEIRQTSLLAAQKTESVLKTAERADAISRQGELAVEQSLTGLKEIRAEVAEMAARIQALGERTRLIAGITTTVKDLADQSNMLALNAAIEAVRSGEHGKGFGVVAREIRSLADQSIKATNRVREILEDISDAIRNTVVITERGTEKIQVSLVQVQASGESLKELSGIVRDNGLAVRQIAAAVGQQNAGISQIFEAVRDLGRMMDDAMSRLQATEGASKLVGRVAEEVSATVADYGGEPTTPAGETPAALSSAKAA